MSTNTQSRFAVIGAGPVGLAIAKALKEKGVPYDHYDASDGVGGNWRHGVYETTHIISSKKTTEYADYPMPEDYPDFPSGKQMLEYLEDYADHFGLTEHVQLNTKIEAVRPADGERWEVELSNGETKIYKGVLACNGHHWDRKWPDYPGEFSGEIMHSKDYKRPSQLAGKRVLVIGGGNSACDVVSEAARVGASAHISQRRGYWLLPKTVFGIPTAELPMRHLPRPMQVAILKTILRVVVGKYSQYGLQEPDHKIFEHHPTVNSELLHYLKHGKVKARPDIARYDGEYVEFTDGSREAFDLIVCATGFHVSYPFLPKGLVEVKGAVPQVYGGSMVRGHKNLYLVGWAQPRYGFGPLVTPAAGLLADLVVIQDSCTHPLGDVLHSVGDKPPASHLMDPMKTLRLMRKAKKRIRFLPFADKRLTKKLRKRGRSLVVPRPA